MRVLGQNMQNLGRTVGQIAINAFKPFMASLNSVILKLNDFAIMIANSLGKIFGWTYQAGSGGGASEALGNMADDSEDLASGLGNASDKAKELKNNLLGIDELNVISPDDGSGGSGGSGGGSGAGAGGGASDSMAGQWVQTEKMFESDLDTLYKLGDAISKNLIKAMESIDWDSIYEKARHFGSGLAEFLNGLFADQNGITLFGEVGKTIAKALNTVIYTSLAFTDTFNFEQFGKNIADGINNFFENFDFKSLAQSINGWVDGIEKTIKGFFKEIDWGDIVKGIGDFIGNLDADTIFFIIGAVSLKKFGKSIGKVLLDATKTGIAQAFEKTALYDIGFRISNALGGLSLPKIMLKVAGFTLALASARGMLENNVEDWRTSIADTLGVAIGASAIGGFKAGLYAFAISATIAVSWSIGNMIGSGATGADPVTMDEFFDALGYSFKEGIFLDALAYSVKETFTGISDTIYEAWDLDKLADKTGFYVFVVEEAWAKLKNDTVEKWESIKDGIAYRLENIKGTIMSKINPIIEPIINGWNLVKGYTSEAWQTIKNAVATPIENIRNTIVFSFEYFKTTISNAWSNIKDKTSTWWENIKTVIANAWGGIFNGSSFSLSSIGTAISDTWNGIKFVTAIYWSQIKDTVNGVWDKIKDGISNAWNGLGDAISDLWNKIKFVFAIYVNKAKDWGKDMIDNFCQGIKDKFPFIDDVMNFLTTNISKWIHFSEPDKGPLSNFHTFAPDMMDLFTKGIRENMYKVENAVGDMANVVSSGVNVTGTTMITGQLSMGTPNISGTSEISSLSSSFSSGMNEEVALLRQQNQLLTQILAKDTSVNIGDREIARANQRGQRAMGLTLRTT